MTKKAYIFQVGEKQHFVSMILNIITSSNGSSTRITEICFIDVCVSVVNPSAHYTYYTVNIKSLHVF